jgi:4-diphosphocytidyl-2-C-methyl-D-erythritol kinase
MMTLPMDPEPALLCTVAPAKINWTLEVLGRRPDGYHEIRSVMQTVALQDSVSLQSAPSCSVDLSGPEAAGLDPVENLVMRTLRCFPVEMKNDPVRICVSKVIPQAAGLGGGSSDAAATLRLLRRRWRLGGAEVLARVAPSLGSDVPFFLRGGAQVAGGRGETLEPLPAPDTRGRPGGVLILTPPIRLPDKTARLFAELGPEHFTDGGRTARLVGSLHQRSGRAPTADDYFNAFDAVADHVFPGLARYRRLLEELTGSRAMLAGAGPSLFAIPAVRGGAATALDALRRRGLRAWYVRAIDAGEATLEWATPPQLL